MTSEIISPEEWAKHLLHFDGGLAYLKNSGSLIRFVAVEDYATHLELDSVLDEMMNEHGMWFFGAFQCKETPMYRPDIIVKNIAQNLPFTIESILINLCKSIWKSLGVTDDDIILSKDASIHLEEDQKHVERIFRTELRKRLGRELKTSDETENSGIWHYTRDFSNGVMNVCYDLIINDQSTVTTFENWLKGFPTPAKDRRDIGIMSNIDRPNASPVLRSLIALCSLSDNSECILRIDIRATTDPTFFADSIKERRPSKTGIVGTYQWLRELIDQCSLFKSTLIVVETGPGFLDISPDGKGVGIYDALKNRIIDDVSVIGRANLSAVLLPVSA
jgi:hypothetical protein